MGWGDEIMALGRAEAAFLKTGRPVAIVDNSGIRRKNILWDGNPAVDELSDDHIIDAPGHRPYIDRWEGNRIILNTKYRARAGRVMLSEKEETLTDVWLADRKFAVISPFIKHNASINKDWGADRWADVVKHFPLPVYQLGGEGTPMIKGALLYKTATMREAAAVISQARIVLANEGGIHHLAASMGRPAVVVFGGFMHPKVTGYNQHANLIGDPMHIGCGKYEPCPACRKSLDKITPSMVLHAARGQLYGKACH